MQTSSSTADSKWINVKQSICEIMQPSSSSSSSKPDHPAYSTADSEWIKVKQWDDDLVATAASSRVEWINHKKLATGVNREYLLFDDSDNPLFAQEANTLLATLTPSFEHPLPKRTFARILTLVSKKAPNYCWKRRRTSTSSGARSKRAGETAPIPSWTPPQGVEWELPHERIINDFGQLENLTAYQKVHEKNIGPLRKPEEFNDLLEMQLTIALRGLVGFVLRDLARPGEKFEDLPVLRDWLRQDWLGGIDASYPLVQNHPVPRRTVYKCFWDDVEQCGGEIVASAHFSRVRFQRADSPLGNQDSEGGRDGSRKLMVVVQAKQRRRHNDDKSSELS
ncbi:hypothetical protein ARMGADRAFT_1041068 [Armillaria gallica]|uniref:Uncharacterized protein n=1 Tax=Armillaria gallica TaxID=47427 RepID=A0A2H3CAY9_ARMGA|nr:hypothetical protein ARMGADRAFT_1041068 [Armillaria gallica]